MRGEGELIQKDKKKCRGFKNLMPQRNGMSNQLRARYDGTIKYIALALVKISYWLNHLSVYIVRVYVYAFISANMYISVDILYTTLCHKIHTPIRARTPNIYERSRDFSRFFSASLCRSLFLSFLCSQCLRCNSWQPGIS